MEFQSGLFIAALISAVTYAWPWWMLAGGWSLLGLDGVIQLTEGRLPPFAALKYELRPWTLATWWSACTSPNSGSGFQIPGVEALCLTGAQVSAESRAQSGWAPFCT